MYNNNSQNCTIIITLSIVRIPGPHLVLSQLIVLATGACFVWKICNSFIWQSISCWACFTESRNSNSPFCFCMLKSRTILWRLCLVNYTNTASSTTDCVSLFSQQAFFDDFRNCNIIFLIRYDFLTYCLIYCMCM